MRTGLEVGSAVGRQTNPVGHLGLAAERFGRQTVLTIEVDDIGKGLFVAVLTESASLGLNPAGPIVKKYKTFFFS